MNIRVMDNLERRHLAAWLRTTTGWLGRWKCYVPWLDGWVATGAPKVRTERLGTARKVAHRPGGGGDTGCLEANPAIADVVVKVLPRVLAATELLLQGKSCEPYREHLAELLERPDESGVAS